MATFVEYFETLATEVLRVSYPATQVFHGVPLLHALYETWRTPEPGQNPRGGVIYSAVQDLSDATWLAVSAQVLSDLNYDDEAAWIAAASLDTFIREQDRESVRSHIDPVSPSAGIYSPWVIRGNGAGYREMRAQGLNLTTPAGQIRVTLLWRP